MSAIRGARERARIEVTAAIKDEARRQLAAEGAAKLSLRAVARELGMVSSALYRYFPSRDDLLTALIVDAYDSVGEAAESALTRTGTGTGTGTETGTETGTGTGTHAATDTGEDDTDDDHVSRWVDVCEAVRGWALEHTHEYALIYGSPVPGYTAPQDTIGPAARVGLALIAVARDAHAAGGLSLPPLTPVLEPEASRIAADFAPDLPPETAAAMVAAWSQLFGTISFEVFGQFNRVVEDRDTFFHHTATQLARHVGLVRHETP